SHKEFIEMSGHSKWHTIKHKKGALDAKRGKLFTKLIKEITVAARTGGGDPDANARLRKAISDAKGANMPNDTIDRAVKRGTGELEGVSYDEITYEGYGPGGVAIMVESMTDNRNRTVAEIRHLFSKNGGNLGASGSVSYLFDKKGYIVVDKGAKSEDELFELVIEAGAEDLRDDEDNFEIITAPESFDSVLSAVKGAGIEPQVAEVEMVPQNYVKLEGPDAKQMLKLMESLEDHDDVQKVSANFDISEADME
ncbi:MAG TPA: YebC/PmpR family DNA-binding transcriptional regulator, partial [Pyrinomonadaceae bacterium]|nr:YebC/PmpR family DNA-binding transcriptional regulator [Pyrinomonadaceae bacterium]